MLDSSVILAWVLDDEDHLGPDLLRRLTTTEVATVPCHWILEVTNGLQMAVKRRRLAADDPPKLLARIGKQPVDPEAQADEWSCLNYTSHLHDLLGKSRAVQVLRGQWPEAIPNCERRLLRPLAV